VTAVATVNRRITLAARPVGFPKVSDFQLAYATVPSPTAGEVLVRSVYLSLEPHTRVRMSADDSDATPIAIGEVIAGAAVALVVASEHPDFRAGDLVEGLLGWQEFAVVEGQALRRIDSSRGPISTALGVMGPPGLTAFFGLLDVCDPQPEETVVVSAAAGAVGMLAGQIARLRGCRVVGVTASDAQRTWLVDDLGFDAAIDARSSADLDATLAATCPDGVDVYFDNVGGQTTDAVLRRLNAGARISLCGELSQYNLVVPEAGPRLLARLIAAHAKVQGFLISRYAARFPEGLQQLFVWLKEGVLQYRQDVAQGLEAAPQAFIAMLHERNHGEQLVHISES
jgi:NADPH-dependent curcumin reductase CurA